MRSPPRPTSPRQLVHADADLDAFLTAASAPQASQESDPEPIILEM